MTKLQYTVLSALIIYLSPKLPPAHYTPTVGRLLRATDICIAEDSGSSPGRSSMHNSCNPANTFWPEQPHDASIASNGQVHRHPKIDSPEKISLDITRHLQFRASIGRVAVITERPQVLLGVIKKRWSKVTQEVKKEYSRTLQADKKAGLKAQLMALPAYTFATSEQDTEASIVFTSLDQPLPATAFQTIYVAHSLTHIQLMNLLKALLPRGLLVSYTSDWDE